MFSAGGKYVSISVTASEIGQNELENIGYWQKSSIVYPKVDQLEKKREEASQTHYTPATNTQQKPSL